LCAGRTHTGLADSVPAFFPGTAAIAVCARAARHAAANVVYSGQAAASAGGIGSRPLRQTGHARAPVAERRVAEGTATADGAGLLAAADVVSAGPAAASTVGSVRPLREAGHASALVTERGVAGSAATADRAGLHTAADVVSAGSAAASAVGSIRALREAGHAGPVVADRQFGPPRTTIACGASLTECAAAASISNCLAAAQIRVVARGPPGETGLARAFVTVRGVAGSAAIANGTGSTLHTAASVFRYALAAAVGRKRGGCSFRQTREAEAVVTELAAPTAVADGAGSVWLATTDSARVSLAAAVGRKRGGGSFRQARHAIAVVTELAAPAAVADGTGSAWLATTDSAGGRGAATAINIATAFALGYAALRRIGTRG